MTDPVLANIRRELVLAAVQRAPVAVMSVHDDVECVAIGKIVKVSPRHVIVSTTKTSESAIPIESITSLKRLDENRETAPDEAPPAPEAA